MNDPERDPWPSVENPPDELACDFCEAMPDEDHAPTCPLATVTDGPLELCYGCGCYYIATCPCDGDEDR